MKKKMISKLLIIFLLCIILFLLCNIYNLNEDITYIKRNTDDMKHSSGAEIVNQIYWRTDALIKKELDTLKKELR